MSYDIRDFPQEDWPEKLLEIPQVPKSLRIAGSMPPVGTKFLAVVGSRKASEYGKAAVHELLSRLAGLPISIISGLALGIDTCAHREALKAGLHTIAVPGSGLSPRAIYPHAHFSLAEEIVSSGGALISEFEDNFQAAPWSFPQRNRIMAGLSDAVLIVEAGEKSGTLITARLGLDYGREVLALPGSIFAEGSFGPLRLMRDGAAPVRNADDILEALGLQSVSTTPKEKDYTDLSDEEKKIVELLLNPMSRDELARESGMQINELNALLTLLEIKGIVTEEMGEIRLC